MTNEQERILAAEMVIKALDRAMTSENDMPQEMKTLENLQVAFRAYTLCYPKPMINDFPESECVSAFDKFTKRVKFLEMQ